MWLYMRGIYIEVWGLVSDMVMYERYIYIEVWGLVSDVVIYERYIYRGMVLSE